MGSGVNIGSLFWKTGIDTTGLKRDSKSAQGALSGLLKPSILGAAALGAALLKVGSDALSFSRDFETAFAEVQTISEEARNSADAMKESILEMTTKIPVGAIESTKALYQIVSAGYAGADAMNVLEISAKAAVAGSSTTAVAADTLTTIMNSYGMSADEAMKASDMLFKTVEMGKTTLNEIGASFSQVASMAASYGVGLNESLAATAALTKLGTPTAEAMTQMKAAIIAVTKSLGENIFKTMSFGDAMVLARQKADESGEGLQKYFGSVEAVNFVLKMTGKNTEAYAESLDGLTKSAGTTEAALVIMNDTFDSQYKILKNNVTVAFTGFGNLIKDSILPAMKAFNESVSNDALSGQAKAIDNQRKRLRELIFTLNDSTIAESDRLKILEEIEKISPDIAKNIKKEGDEYKIAADKLVEFNTQKLNEIALEIELQKIREQGDIATKKGVEAQEKLVEIQRKRIEAFTIIAKKNQEDGDLVKAILDGSIKKGTEFSEVQSKFGEKTALFLNQAGLQQVQTEQDFATFQNIAVKGIATRNGLTLKEIGLNREFFDLVSDFNVLFTEQNNAANLATSIDEKRIKLAKLLGIELDKNAETQLGGGGGGKNTLGITEKLDKELKDLKAALDKATTEESYLEIFVKIKVKEREIEDFKDEIEKKFLDQRNVVVPVKIQPITSTADVKGGIDVEEIKAANSEFDKLNKKIKEGAKKGKELQDALDLGKAAEKKEALTRLFFDISDSAYFLSQSLKDSNSEIAGMLSGVADLSSSIGRLNDLGAFSEEGMSNMDALSMGIEGATKLIGMMVSQSAENKKVMEEYYASIIKQQSDYNLLLNDQILMGDKIGPELYTDYQSQLDTGAKAFIDANNELNEGMRDFLTNEAVVGKDNVVAVGNVLAGAASGAALGAAIGSVVPVIGTLIGGIIGAIGGTIAGWFTKKKEDVVEPLLAKYPDLIKANGQFNASLAKTLVGTGLVTAETDAALQEMIKWSEAAEKAREQIVGVVEDIVGGIGNDLNNALVTAFEDGTDAAIAMGEVLNDVLENYISQLIFAATMGPYLDKLTEDMFASVGLDPDGNVPDVPIDPSIADGSFADDIGRFFDSYGAGVERYNQGIEDAQAEAAEYGMDLFQPSDQDQTQTGLSGAIRASLTEDTGSLLAGIWRRHLDETINHTSIMTESNSYLSTISENTLRTAVACEALASSTNQDGRDLGV